MNIAYIGVSKNKSDSLIQKKAIINYALKQDLSIDEYIKLANFIVDNPPEVAPVKEKRHMSKSRLAHRAQNDLKKDSAPEAE